MRILATVLLASCMNMQDTSSLKSGGAADNRAAWFRSPEEIKETIIKTFCVSLGQNIEDGRSEIGDYIYTIGTMYGSPDMGNMRTPLEKPNGTYLLALDVVSMWLSNKLLQKQFMLRLRYPTNADYQRYSEEKERGWLEDSACSDNPKDNHNNRYLFNGNKRTRHAIRDAAACQACYADDTKTWCDCQDNVYLGEFSKDMSLSQAQRKRIMHNIQDMGDFLGVSVDNEVIAKDNTRHAPRMLLEDVFIPALVNEGECNTYALLGYEGDDDNAAKDAAAEAVPQEGGDYYQDSYEEEQDDAPPLRCTDYVAWQQVVHTLLMSGPFYVKLETVRR